jgi:hypothetical protein
VTIRTNDWGVVEYDEAGADEGSGDNDAEEYENSDHRVTPRPNANLFMTHGCS